MLDFWYSERCTREIKLIVCISTCVMIMLCGQIASLSPVFVGFSLAVGVVIHIIRMLSVKIQSSHSHQTGFQIIFLSVILIAMISLIINLPKSHQWALAAQCLGYIAIGFMIVSIYSNRAKRFE